MMTNELKIREARSDSDYHRAYPFITQLFPWLDLQTYCQRVFTARATGYRMFIGEVDGDAVGVIGIIHNHNIHDGFVTYIEHVVVDHDHRNKGYGGLLIKFAEDRAMEEGCTLIEMDTDTGNDEAEKLYIRNGYKVSGKYLFKDLKRGGY